MTLCITGRVYSAMMAFCGGKLPLMFKDGEGHIYASDQYVMMRWTVTCPVTPETAYLFNHKDGAIDFCLDKVSAAQAVSIENPLVDELARIPRYHNEDGTKNPNGIDSFFTGSAKKNEVTYLDIDIKYIEKAVKLVKAVKTELKDKNTTAVRIDTGSIPSIWSIGYGNKGSIDFVMMPLRRSEYFEKAED